MPNRSPQDIWETALGHLELQVTRPNYETWLRPTLGLRMEGDSLVVGVHTDFALEWLRSRLSVLADRTVTGLVGRTVGVTFEVLGAKPATSPAQDGPPHTAQGSGLDARLTFDSFVALKCNRLAYRAAHKAAAGQAGYTLLLLSGPSGTGKTHLLHAIGNEALRSGRNVVALTGEAFVERYVATVRGGHPHTFRQSFTPCDLLLLDDLPFITTRPASQEQFFHLFNMLQQGGCAFALTSDAQLDSLSQLSPRLSTRLSASFTAHLALPAEPERLELLTAEATRLGQALPKEVLAVIARSGRATPAQLNAGLRQVIAHADLGTSPITAAVAAQALQSQPAYAVPPSPRDILETVAQHFAIPTDHLAGTSRARPVSYARHVAAYLMREVSGCSVTQIGKLLGGRDHSTVLSAWKRISRERTTLPETAADIDTLLTAIRSSAA